MRCSRARWTPTTVRPFSLNNCVLGDFPHFEPESFRCGHQFGQSQIAAGQKNLIWLIECGVQQFGGSTLSTFGAAAAFARKGKTAKPILIRFVIFCGVKFEEPVYDERVAFIEGAASRAALEIGMSQSAFPKSSRAQCYNKVVALAGFGGAIF